MNERLQKYAQLYAQNGAVSGIDVSSRASAYLLSGEDDDGLCVLARIVAARICGIPTDRAFDEFADIAVYPKPQDSKKQGKSGKKAEGEKQKRYAVSVDDIREIVGSLYLTPFELDKRVYIIENAESMSEICQNKLLKSLEEPPPRVCFILCASGRMLPTVESRCNKIELAPFDIGVVENELSKYHKDGASVTLAARASRGNFGLAERILADSGFADTYAAAKSILALATGSKMFAKTAAVYEKFTREKTDAVLGVMEYLLCDIARSLVGAYTVFDERDINAIAIGFTPYSAAKSAEHVRTARRHNQANCMPVAVMDSMVLKIMEEKALCRK
ncbi:MAG: hypothetical protein J1G01_06695 [Clostridiales bacterium]|nr:hypothetical protein [Clostridiales bacterium]